MILNEVYKFKKKNFIFKIKKITSKDISKDYVQGLNTNKFVRYNIDQKINKSFQINYIDEHNKSNDKIVVGIFNKNKLIGTCGAQKKSKKKYYIGIFIFNTKYRGLKLSKILICYLSHYLKKKENISYVYASVNRKNNISHNLFKALNFKANLREKKRYKSDVVYFVQIKKLLEINNHSF